MDNICKLIRWAQINGQQGSPFVFKNTFVVRFERFAGSKVVLKFYY